MINTICFSIVFAVGYVLGRYAYTRKEPDVYKAVSSLVDFDDKGKRDCFGLFDRCHKLAIKDRGAWVIGGKCCKCHEEPKPDSAFCHNCGHRLKWR